MRDRRDNVSDAIPEAYPGTPTFYSPYDDSMEILESQKAVIARCGRANLPNGLEESRTERQACARRELGEPSRRHSNACS